MNEQGDLVHAGGRLPLSLELPTAGVLDVLLALMAEDKTETEKQQFRKKLRERLYYRTKPGFYVEINQHLHLAYMGQPGGHNTGHWWRLFYDESIQERVEQFSNGALAVIPRTLDGSMREWGGMYFRSETEVKIAKALDRQKVLFFANCRGRVAEKGSPASADRLTGRVEIDFLVFRNGKSLVLEIDGKHHQEGSQTIRDYIRDRVLLREGIPTVRFTAQECYNQPEEVVQELLNIFGCERGN